MTAHQSDPLVGPIRRRSWRDVVRLTPLTAHPHLALVVSRRGRVISVIPANARRVLSDYLDWPFEYREVDMRERLLELDLRLDSQDIGYAFTVALQIVYQVVRPERVAVEHADVLHEFEEAIIQRARAIAQKLGIEEGGRLREYLVEALMTGNELPQRFDQLGLALRRVDMTIDLDRHARELAESIREQFRDRPLLIYVAIESNQPGAMFEVRIGGFYRLRTRDGERPTPGAAEQIIRTAVQRSLYRVAARFAPYQEREAAAAMTDELWNDMALKATLAASNLELLRPAVQVQAGRRALSPPAPRLMLADSQIVEPTAPDRQQADMQPDHALHAIPSFRAHEAQADDSPRCQAAGAADDDDTRHGWIWNDHSSGAPGSSHSASSLSPIWDDERNDAGAMDDVQAETSTTPPETAAPEANVCQPAGEPPDATSLPPGWLNWQLPLEPVEQPETRSMPGRSTASQPSSDHSRHEIVARWIELLRAQEAWLFRYVARIIVAHPEKTAEVIGNLTTDPALCDRVTDPDCAALLAETLKSILEMEGAEERLPAGAGQSALGAEEEPDWMVFRRAVNDS